MENRNQTTKAVVEAGMISALVVLMTLISMYLGLSGYAGVCILPIPITVVYIRQNAKIAFITVLVSTILVGLLFNPLQAVTNTFLMGLIGMSLGFCLKRNFSSMKVYVVFGIVVSIGLFIYAIIYVELVTGIGIYATIDNGIKLITSSIVKSIGTTAVNTSQKNLLESIKRIDVNYILKLMPGGLTVVGFIFSYINYKIATKILKRLKYKTQEMFSLTRIYLPNKAGVFMIIIVLIGYILTLNKLLVGEYVLQSSFLVLVAILTVSGTSLTAYYLINKYKVSKKIVIIILAIGFIFNLYQAFVIFGLVDLVMNFRKLDINPIFKK